MKRRTVLAGLPFLASCAATRGAPGYRVVNLMPDYWAYEAQAAGLSEAAKIALFKRMVIDRHPHAYTAHVIGLAEDKPFDDELARRWPRVERILAGKTELMRKLSDSIATDLPRYETRFREGFPDLAYDGDIYFMHSLGAFDGATRMVNGRVALLFGIDMIAYVYGTDVDPQPFFHHELFHIYHSQFMPEVAEDDTLARGLWGEGLATYVAQALNPTASGISIFGLPRSMPARTQARLRNVARGLRAVLDSKAQRDYEIYFIGNREDADPPSRSGYYVGFLIAQRMAKKHSLRELARMPMERVRPEMEEALDALAAGEAS